MECLFSSPRVPCILVQILNSQFAIFQDGGSSQNISLDSLIDAMDLLIFVIYVLLVSLFFWYFPSASLQTHFIDYVRGQAGWQVWMRFSDKICSRHKLAKLIPHSFCSSNQLCYFDVVFSNSHHKQGCNICFSFHFHMNLFS